MFAFFQKKWHYGLDKRKKRAIMLAFEKESVKKAR